MLRLGEREAHLLKEPDDADGGDGVGRKPPMPRDASGGPHESELVVVPRRRGRETGALCELADRQECRHRAVKCTDSGPIDFRCT
jgi:hypothetical protein